MKPLVALAAALVAGLAVLLPAAFPLSPPGPASPSPGWRLELVEAFGGSAPPEIALDGAGSPRIAYYPPGRVQYAVRAASWESETVATSAWGGASVDFALGPGDVPHLLYRGYPGTSGGADGTYLAVKVNGTWTFASRPCGGSDMAVDPRGVPRIVCFGRTEGGARWSVRYHTLLGGSWTTEYVDVLGTAISGSAWISLALDRSGEPRVLYYEGLMGDVRYASRNETGWHVEVVEHIGDIAIVGREGGLALDSAEEPHAVYSVRTGPKAADVRYAVRSGGGWNATVISQPPPVLGGGGFSPSISTAPAGPTVTYLFVTQIDPVSIIYTVDLVYASLSKGGWSSETVLHGGFNGTTREGALPQFPSLAADRCRNPHIAFYFASNVDAGAYYTTKGPPCRSPTRGVSLHLEPRTLNLKSQGRWVSARIAVENATASDVDPASLVLNGVPAARVETLDNTTLAAKFDRRAFVGTVQPGESVVVTLTGRWRDGGTFTATDAIRVINPGGGPGKP